MIVAVFFFCFVRLFGVLTHCCLFHVSQRFHIFYHFCGVLLHCFDDVNVPMIVHVCDCVIVVCT